MLTSQRQYIAGPAAELKSVEGCTIDLGESFRVIHSRNLSVSRGSTSAAEIVVLGQIVDPANPAHDNGTVTRHLLTRISSFEEFEEHSSKLAGRWVAFVCFDNEWRVYPDACGTRTVYYTDPEKVALKIAAQPGLLRDIAGVQLVPGLRRQFMEHQHHAASWPLALTPYDGVKQLLPNHYLRIRDGRAVRFWPMQEIANSDQNSAIETAVSILRGTISALTYRGRSALPLTGGVDSRTLLACSKDREDNLTLVRVTGYHLPFYDSKLPRVLAKRVQRRLETIRSMPESTHIVSAVTRNTADMWWDPADYMIHSFHRIRCEFLLLGQISEITRCFYYPTGEHPTNISPRSLALLAHYDDNPLAIEAIADWLDGVPQHAGSYLLDLLYWEHRVGNWAANLANALDTFYEPIFPYNCRQLLTTLLGVPVQYRAPPYELHRLICHAADPRLDGIPFNDSFIDRVVGSHWRIGRMMKSVRKLFSKF